MPKKAVFKLTDMVTAFEEMPDDAIEALEAFFCRDARWHDVRTVIRFVYRKISKAATRTRLRLLMAELHKDRPDYYDRGSVFEVTFPAWAKLREDVDAYAIKHNFPPDSPSTPGYHDLVGHLVPRR